MSLSVPVPNEVVMTGVLLRGFPLLLFGITLVMISINPLLQSACSELASGK